MKALRELAFLFPGLAGGDVVTGAQVAEIEFLRALLKHGTFESLLIVVRGDRKQLGIVRELLGGPTRADRCRFALLREMPQLISNDTPDVLHVSHIVTPHFAYLRQRFSLRPFPITSIVHSIAHLDTKIVIDRNMLFPASDLDVAVCPSRHLHGAFRSIAREVCDQRSSLSRKRWPLPRTAVIPFGLDTNQFSPRSKRKLRAANGLRPQDVILLYVGRLSPWTKMDLLPLIVAFRRLVRRCPDIPLRLILAGQEQTDGYASVLAAAARSLGVGERVLIWTHVDRQEMPNIYAIGDIFVSPSDSIQETFGLSPIEAMASGLAPVVASWNGYKEHIRDGETGYLVPTYRAPPDPKLTDAALFIGYDALLAHLCQTTAIDLDVMVERLAALATSRSARERMGQRARAAIIRKYSWPAVISQYEQLWRKARERAGRFNQSRNVTAMGVYQTNYSKHFAHYPSHRFAPNARIVAVGSEQESLSDETLRGLARIAQVDWNLACHLRERLLGSKLSLAALRSEGECADAVKRALVFLFKHGLIKTMT